MVWIDNLTVFSLFSESDLRAMFGNLRSISHQLAAWARKWVEIWFWTWLLLSGVTYCRSCCHSHIGIGGREESDTFWKNVWVPTRLTAESWWLIDFLGFLQEVLLTMMVWCVGLCARHCVCMCRSTKCNLYPPTHLLLYKGKSGCRRERAL